MIDWRARTVGEQSREVRSGPLGLSEQELDELERDGATGTEPRLAGTTPK